MAITLRRARHTGRPPRSAGNPTTCRQRLRRLEAARASGGLADPGLNPEPASQYLPLGPYRAT